MTIDLRNHTILYEDISLPINCQNRLYFALSSYLMFQDLPKHMIGYIVLISNSMKKIAVCPDDRLL